MAILASVERPEEAADDVEFEADAAAEEVVWVDVIKVVICAGADVILVAVS